MVLFSSFFFTSGKNTDCGTLLMRGNNLQNKEKFRYCQQNQALSRTGCQQKYIEFVESFRTQRFEPIIDLKNRTLQNKENFRYCQQNKALSRTGWWCQQKYIEFVESFRTQRFEPIIDLKNRTLFLLLNILLTKKCHLTFL